MLAKFYQLPLRVDVEANLLWFTDAGLLTAPNFSLPSAIGNSVFEEEAEWLSGTLLVPDEVALHIVMQCLKTQQ